MNRRSEVHDNGIDQIATPAILPCEGGKTDAISILPRIFSPVKKKNQFNFKEAAMGWVRIAEPVRTTRRMINLLTGEVWCPYHNGNVNVLVTCVESSSQSGCPYYDRLDLMSGLHCKYTEEDHV